MPASICMYCELPVRFHDDHSTLNRCGCGVKPAHMTHRDWKSEMMLVQDFTDAWDLPVIPKDYDGDNWLKDSKH
jgi:hypothetical protein